MKKQKQIVINMRQVQASVRKPVTQDQKAIVFQDRRRKSRQLEKNNLKRGQWE